MMTRNEVECSNIFDQMLEFRGREMTEAELDKAGGVFQSLMAYISASRRTVQRWAKKQRGMSHEEALGLLKALFDRSDKRFTDEEADAIGIQFADLISALYD